jgi:hypothetical protein
MDNCPLIRQPLFFLIVNVEDLHIFVEKLHGEINEKAC